jgi:hypothetical protein
VTNDQIGVWDSVFGGGCQIRMLAHISRLASLETCDTADLEVCVTRPVHHLVVRVRIFSARSCKSWVSSGIGVGTERAVGAAGFAVVTV